MQNNDENPKKQIGTKKWFYYLSLGIILIIVYKFFDNFTGIGRWLSKLLGILAPFLVGIIITFVLYLPQQGAEKFLKQKCKMKKPRVLSITIVYIAVAIILFLLFQFLIPMLFESVNDLLSHLPDYYNSITNNQFEASWAPQVQEKVIKPIVEYLQGIDLQSLFTSERIQTYLQSAVGAAKGLASTFIAIVSSIYILARRESIIGFFDHFAKASLSEKAYYRFNRYFSNGADIFLKYISSQVLDGCVVAVVMSIALSIIKVKYAILLGIVIGVFNLVPYFGAIIAVIAVALITILTGGWKQALITLVVTVILQQIDANIINPKITSSRLETTPLLVVFSVTVGGAYFGVAGMLIAVPVAVLIKLMCNDYIESHNAGKEIERDCKEDSKDDENLYD